MNDEAARLDLGIECQREIQRRGQLAIQRGQRLLADKTATAIGIAVVEPHQDLAGRLVTEVGDPCRQRDIRTGAREARLELDIASRHRQVGQAGYRQHVEGAVIVVEKFGDCVVNIGDYVDQLVTRARYRQPVDRDKSSLAGAERIDALRRTDPDATGVRISVIERDIESACGFVTVVQHRCGDVDPTALVSHRWAEVQVLEADDQIRSCTAFHRQ